MKKEPIIGYAGMILMIIGMVLDDNYFGYYFKTEINYLGKYFMLLASFLYGIFTGHVLIKK